MTEREKCGRTCQGLKEGKWGNDVIIFKYQQNGIFKTENKITNSNIRFKHLKIHILGIFGKNYGSL